MLEGYQGWVRANPRAASAMEQVIRIGVLVSLDPTSLLAMELGYAVANVVSILNESSWSHELAAPSSASERHSQTWLRLVRETQCVLELLIRRYRPIGAASALVFVLTIESVKLALQVHAFSDVWLYAGRCLEQRQPARATRLPAAVIMPLVVGRQPAELSGATLAGLLVDAVDIVRPLLYSVALATMWHQKRSLHRAWMLWFVGLAWEIAAFMLSRMLIRRPPFVRENGTMVLRLSDRGREQCWGLHLLRYPFFNLIVAPEIQQRIIDGWIGRVPLLGTLFQCYARYVMEIQKFSIEFSSGS